MGRGDRVVHPPLVLLLAALRRDGGKYAVYAAGDASLTAGAVDRDALELLLLALVASNMVLIISVNWSLSCPRGTAAALARVSVWQAHPSTQRSNGQTYHATDVYLPRFGLGAASDDRLGGTGRFGGSTSAVWLLTGDELSSISTGGVISGTLFGCVVAFPSGKKAKMTTACKPIFSEWVGRGSYATRLRASPEPIPEFRPWRLRPPTHPTIHPLGHGGSGARGSRFV